MKRKNILLFLAICLMNMQIKCYSKKAVQDSHDIETSYAQEGLAALSQELMKQEATKWKAVIDKKPYPTAADYPSALTQDDVSNLLAALDDLESGKAQTKYYRSGLSPDLNEIFLAIQSAATKINNEPIAAKRSEITWYNKQDQLWKPIVTNFFQHARALIKSFGSSSKKISPMKQQIKQEVSSKKESSALRYFTSPKTGATMQDL